MADGIEARRTPRHDITRPLRIFPEAGEAIPGTMQNVNQGGMLVALPVELELGRTYEVEVTDSQGVFLLNGEALRLHLPARSSEGSQGSGFRTGFEFVGSDAAVEERLARLLEEVAP
ncbi:MAG: PilZ domain-containing protein [Candidatus Methylomirabilales bacterium]